MGRNGALANLLSGGEWVGDREEVGEELSSIIRPRGEPSSRKVGWAREGQDRD